MVIQMFQNMSKLLFFSYSAEAVVTDFRHWLIFFDQLVLSLRERYQRTIPAAVHVVYLKVVFLFCLVEYEHGVYRFLQLPQVYEFEIAVGGGRHP